MSTSTTNYGFIKPDASEDVDVAIINANYDDIDASLKVVDDRSVQPTFQSDALDADYTITTTDTDMTVSVTFSTAKTNVKVGLTATADFKLTTAGTGNNYCAVWVDGVFSTDMLFDFPAAAVRVTSSVSYFVTLAASGSHTIKLRAKKDVGAGVAQFLSPRTRLVLNIYDK